MVWNCLLKTRCAAACFKGAMTAFGVIVCKALAYSIQNCLLFYEQNIKIRQLPESKWEANFKGYSKGEIAFVHFCSTENGAHPDAPLDRYFGVKLINFENHTNHSIYLEGIKTQCRQCRFIGSQQLWF